MIDSYFYFLFVDRVFHWRGNLIEFSLPGDSVISFDDAIVLQTENFVEIYPFWKGFIRRLKICWCDSEFFVIFIGQKLIL